jgi:DNA-directed RNA polymerase specialized sigma24 family protein
MGTVPISILNHGAYSFPRSSVVSALHFAAAQGEDQAIQFLADVLYDDRARPLWYMASNGLASPARLGSFKAWLRQIARTKVIAHWRKNRKHREGMDSLKEEGENGYLPLSERLPQSDAVDFDAIWEEQWQKDLFEAAKERGKATAKPRQYQIFHCSVVKEWPAARVMRELQVNMGQVYFARRKIARMTQEEVARLERLGR